MTLQCRRAASRAREEKRRANCRRPSVKFDTETLPAILNAITTDNGGQTLVLEVAVCRALRSRCARNTYPRRTVR